MEKDRGGRAIKFGLRLKKHLEDHHSPSECIRRKEHLLYARSTVRSGERIEVAEPKTGEVKAYYAKFFSDQGKEKGFLSIVNTKDGEVFTAFRSPRSYIEKRGFQIEKAK